MAHREDQEHVWIGRCGCYSDIAKPSRKPWFWKPQFDSEDLHALIFGRDYWERGRIHILWGLIRPVFFGGDEYCRTTLVLGFPITGRIVIPLWGHNERTCGDCPLIDSETGESVLDSYLKIWKEIDNDKTI